MPLRLTPSVCTTFLQTSSWEAPAAVGPLLKTEGTRRFPSTEQCGIGDVASRSRPFLLASSSGSTRGSTRHGTPSLPGKTPPPFPRPPNLCLQSPHPATDTLQGVAARRGRRGAGGEDAEPLAPGLRKMVPLRRHGGSGRASDQPFRFTPRTARRACLCGTQGGRRRRMRRHRPPGWVPSGRKPLPSVSPWSAGRMQKRKGPCRKPASNIPVFCLCRGTEVAGTNR